MSTVNVSGTFRELLVNPFARISDYRALGVGLSIILLSALIGAATNSWFDGVLDMHIRMEMSVVVAVLMNVCNWIIMTSILLISGMIMAKSHFRIIDIAGTMAFARWPYLLAALSTLLIKIPGFGGTNYAIIIIGSIALASSILMVWLMYSSFCISFDLKGTKPLLVFILSLFIAEVISKLAYAYVFRVL